MKTNKYEQPIEDLRKERDELRAKLYHSEKVNLGQQEIIQNLRVEVSSRNFDLGQSQGQADAWKQAFETVKELLSGALGVRR